LRLLHLLLHLRPPRLKTCRAESRSAARAIVQIPPQRDNVGEAITLPALRSVM